MPEGTASTAVGVIATATVAVGGRAVLGSISRTGLGVTDTCALVRAAGLVTETFTAGDVEPVNPGAPR